MVEDQRAVAGRRDVGTPATMRVLPVRYRVKVHAYFTYDAVLARGTTLQRFRRWRP